MTIWSLLVYSLVHASFTSSVSRGMLQLWRPKPILTSDGIDFLPGSKRNLKDYTRAAVLLNDGHGSFASLDMGTMNLYIHKDSRIVLCLWSVDEARRDVAFTRLRQWYAESFPDAPPLRASLRDDDQRAWNQSTAP